MLRKLFAVAALCLASMTLTSVAMAAPPSMLCFSAAPSTAAHSLDLAAPTACAVTPAEVANALPVYGGRVMPALYERTPSLSLSPTVPAKVLHFDPGRSLAPA